MADEVHEGEPEEAKHIAGVEEDVGRPADGVDPDQLGLGAGCGDDDVKLLEEIGVLLLRGSRVCSHLHHWVELLNSGKRRFGPVLSNLQ